MGETLGGYRDVDYGEYQESDAFAAGLAALEEQAARSRCAFMCAEKVPWQCHRRFIAEALVKRDWKVRHILDVDTLWVRKSSCSEVQASPQRVHDIQVGGRPQKSPVFALDAFSNFHLCCKLAIIRCQLLPFEVSSKS